MNADHRSVLILAILPRPGGLGSVGRVYRAGATAVSSRGATRRRFSFGVQGVLGARLVWISCRPLLLRIGFWLPDLWIQRLRSSGRASDLRNYSRRCRRSNRLWILWC